MRRQLLAIIVLLIAVSCDKKEASQPPEHADTQSATATNEAFEPPSSLVSLPGEPRWRPDRVQAVQVALEDKARTVSEGGDYRTAHLVDGKPRFTNQLILEDSPYLQQHAHNPVNWRPWGDEALALARHESKPIFLSVGYATCHWCHVMERESFEDVEIAEHINRYYIPVKVDREERPDVDAVYMAAVRAISGRGGWPMTVWLTPEGEPFWGGTYFPARDGDRPGMPGLLGLLKEQTETWKTEPERLLERGRELTERVQTTMDVEKVERVRTTSDAMISAYLVYERGFDERHGGWGEQKFPMVPRLRFLLRHGRRAPDSTAHRMVRKSLDAMAAGGLRDHVGGGFHRYAVETTWGVPHFEKMLYDNALLALVYLEAGRALDEPGYLEVASDTLNFVIDELGTGSGAYFSALDAESGGSEGRYYTWTHDELEAVGGADVFRLRRGFGLDAGEGALNLRPGAALTDGLLERMRAERLSRERPRTDEKVVAEWNGMLLESFARVGFATGDDRLIELGRRLAVFLREKMVRDGSLARSWTAAGGYGSAGTAADYVFVIAGLVALFEVTGEREWLEFATRLQSKLDKSFFDAERGAYRRVELGREVLAVDIPFKDDATPSANAQAAWNLQKLYALTLRARYSSRAEEVVRAAGGPLATSPAQVPHLLTALDFSADRPREVVVVIDEKRGSPLVDVLRTTFAPSKVFVTGTPQQLSALEDLVPWVKAKGLAPGGAERAYVCYETVCELPARDPATLRKQVVAAEPLQ